MIDCLWYKDQNILSHFVKKLIRKVSSKGVDKFVVWARRETDAYSRTFSIPKNKFVFAPYHATLHGCDTCPSEGDYIFSGGNFGRDYDTLIEAVRGLPIKVHIASTRSELFSHISLPENVIVRGYNHKEFLEKMAGCRINVVSLDATLLHSGGQQTFLNSMWFGKPTIVNDPDGAADYIKHGEDGLLVSSKNVTALREAILMLLNNPEKAREIGEKAKEKAIYYSTEEHFKKILAIVNTVIEK
jgi:glycosyltransferase involved in cell wall biosynthesis